MVVVNPYAKKKRPLPPTLQNESDNDTTKSVPPAAAALSSYATPTTTPCINTTTTTAAAPSSSASALIISASDKAGMQGIDRAKIDDIILRESGNSLFMQQQRKRDEKVNQRIQQLKQKMLLLKDPPQRRPDPKLVYSNAPRATCVVVDMDMFYMACELLTRPELHERPACVGKGMILTSNYKARRYGVRSAMPGFVGDKLVEVLSQGQEQLVHVPSHFDLYQRKSKEVIQVLSQFDPHLRSYSLDEAYLDLGPYMMLKLQHADDDWRHEQIHAALVGTKVTTATTSTTTSNKNADTTQGSNALLEQHDDNDPPPSPYPVMEQPNNTPSSADDSATNTPTITKMEYMNILESCSSKVCLDLASSIVANMRNRVHQVTGLTCSAGLAPNFMLAKIGSDCNKPNGQLCVDPQDVLEFLHPLPLRKIPGIGRVTDKILQAFGMHKVQDLYDQRELVQALFQPATTTLLLRASVGCDSGGGGDGGGEEDSEEASSSSSSQKGMSRERTFSPQDSWTELTRLLEGIAAILSQDLVRKNLFAHTITVKAKLHTFDVLSKSQSLARGVYLQTPNDLATLGIELLKQVRAQFMDAKSKSKAGASFSLRLLGIRCSNLVENGGGEMANSMDKFLEPNPHDDSKTEETDTGWPASPYKNHHHQVSAVADTTSKRKAPTLAELFEKSLSKASETASKQSDYQVDSLSSSCHGKRFVTPVARDKTVEKMTDSYYDTDNHTGADMNSIEEVDSPTFEEVQCPLCNRKIKATDNGTLNRHIDSCLSASAIRQAVREESAVPQEKKKRQRLTDFW